MEALNMGSNDVTETFSQASALSTWASSSFQPQTTDSFLRASSYITFTATPRSVILLTASRIFQRYGEGNRLDFGW